MILSGWSLSCCYIYSVWAKVVNNVLGVCGGGEEGYAEVVSELLKPLVNGVKETFPVDGLGEAAIGGGVLPVVID